MLHCHGDPTRLPLNGYVVDGREPCLVVVHHLGTISDAELEAYLAYMESTRKRAKPGLNSPKKGVLMYVMHPGAAALNAVQRRRQAEWLKANASDDETMVGMAIVLPTAIGRAVMQAIWWLAPPQYAHTIASSEREGREWCETRLREEGVTLLGATVR